MRVFYFFLILTFLLNPAQAIAATDLFLSEQWYLDQIKATDHALGSHQAIVAVLDAGFDLDHEDLIGRYWRNEDEINGDGIDNDRNGFEDDAFGWDFVDSDPDPSPNIENPLKDSVISHGTLISGIIAAQTSNDVGIAGIAQNVRIMPLRILDENGAGSTLSVRSAIEYAVNNGADVINLSFTTTELDERLLQTIEWAHEQGVVIVSAIGNGNLNTDIDLIYPACMDQHLEKNVIIGVAATNKKDKKASFSNFGTHCVDLSAPGTNVFGAVYHDPAVLLLSTAYGSPWEGTSVAAPMVAAAAAQLRSLYPSLTPNQVRSILKLAVDPVKETSVNARISLGAGRLNVKRAIEFAAGFTGGGATYGRARSVTPSGSFVVSQGRGSDPVVKRVNGAGEIKSVFYAYHPEFHGGVRLAMGDINGNGVEEMITGAGPGGGPQVRIFDLNGKVLGQFFALDPGDRLGIFVASGDVNGDGIDEIIVTSDQGGNGQVRIFNNRGQLKGSFFPFGRTPHAIHVSVGNVDDDVESELVMSLGSGTDQRVRIFDGNGRYVREFELGNETMRGFATSIGDIDMDGDNEIIVSAGQYSEPVVMIFDQFGKYQRSFLAYDANFKGGVQVGIADIDQNGHEEIFTIPFQSGGPHVRVFNTQGNAIGGFFAFDSLNRFGGTIAIWNP